MRGLLTLFTVLITGPLAAQSFFEICETGTLEEIQRALENGAKVSERTTNGWTPLMRAAGNNRHLDALVFLLQKGAEVNARDSYGWTPLMWAAAYNPEPEIIKVLVNAGAGINDRAEAGDTPLMLAALLTKNGEVISALLQAGADPKLNNSAGDGAVDFARKNENLIHSNALQKLEKASR